ncbi:MAG: NYN domain-containing protein [Oscillospiraceae bacterium]|jgi:uncharacterized LabA/DUF88 family protein|nr:NYN domain-containing protein [Oscillospiraceae bacterium]
MENKDIRFAVLIDADNAPRNSLKPILQEIAIYGTPTIKRIYGDWTLPNLSGWKVPLLENAIVPIQQYGYTSGKNSTDSAMIIDAMDILYTKSVEGFCIVSSDSDFTRLAIRLREAGMKVLGFGEKKTPNSFIVACDKFIYIEVIRDAFKQAARPAIMAPPERLPAASRTKAHTAVPLPETIAEAVPAEQAVVSQQSTLPDAVIELIAGSVQDIADEEGYAFMGELGNLLLKKQPDFDPRNFGYAKLTSLIKSIPRFEIDARKTRDPNIKHIYLRDKNAV